MKIFLLASFLAITGCITTGLPSPTALRNKNFDKIYKIDVPGYGTTGTGFALKTKHGVLLMTAGHVCDDNLIIKGKKIGLVGVDMGGKSYPQEGLKLSKFNDICVFAKLPKDAPAFELADLPQKIEDITMMGFPGNRGLTVLSGHVGKLDVKTQLPLERKPADCVAPGFKPFPQGQAPDNCLMVANTRQTSIVATGGFSGSPLFNEDNKVVGIASFVNTRAMNLMNIVPLEHLHEEIEQLKL